MSFKNWWRSKMFTRNMMADFGYRTAYSRKPGDFTPYFQYRIGEYQSDSYLYFPKEPYSIQYNNEIFNKLFEYKGYDIIRYLEFHFASYRDKFDFLRFLHYEISERLKGKPGKDRKNKFQAAFDWVGEKLQELQAQDKKLFSEEIGKDIKKVVENQQTDNEQVHPAQVQKIVEVVISRFEEWATPTEEKFQLLLRTLPSGDIELNNQVHQEKLIQLLYLVQTVLVSKGEPLFKKFTNHDLASLLHLHFADFKGKKLNTVEKNIKDSRDKLKPSNPKVEKLEDALQHFFS